jgi:multidrug efflux pump subunit AcrA (membrane-fusion protein)
MKRTFSFLIPLILSLGLQAADANATKADTHKVKAAPFRITVDFKGTFAAAKSHPIKLRTEAWADLTVARDAVAHGTHVSAKDVLVNLKTDKLEQKIADSRLSLEVAKLDLAVAKVEYSFATNNATLDKTAAIRALARLEEDFERYEQKTKAYSEKSTKFSLATSENSLSYVREELKQLKKMYEADDITEETEEIIIKRAQHAVDRSLHYLERSRNSTEATLMFSLPREHVDMKDALTRKQLATGKTNVTHEEKLTKLKLGLRRQTIDLERAEEAHAKLQGDLKKMTVRAPANGVVYYGKFSDGVWTGQKLVKPRLRKDGKLTFGEVFMTVVEIRPLRIQGSVAEKDLRKVVAGITGWATPTAEPGHRVPVKVVSISRVPTAPGQHALTLSTEVADKGYLMPSMGCAVKLEVYENKKAITVPSKGLHQNAAGDMYVKVKDAKGTTIEKVVKIGNSHNGKTEITEGLEESNEVLLP